jgi:hypothetical protein
MYVPVASSSYIWWSAMRIVLLLIALVATRAFAGNVEALLATDPIANANRAFEAGDRVHIWGQTPNMMPKGTHPC